jgi:hypothetical protein
MEKEGERLKKFFRGRVSSIREQLHENPDLDALTIERRLTEELQHVRVDLEFIQDLGRALVALLPSSYPSVQRILSVTNPRMVFEVHFEIFGAFNKRDFNCLEQDGIEYMLAEYIFNVRSVASFAAWKAGLVLAEGWLSTRSEALLVRLMMEARFPAGRMGAINGYRWIIQHRKTFDAEELRPLRVVARNDKSDKVRSNAKFHLNWLIERSKGKYESQSPSTEILTEPTGPPNSILSRHESGHATDPPSEH